ncbi:MAG: nucleotidyltransferase family protein [Gemmatimonadota bacterium]|nr:nucleotidyltransferase family protein [Gemmatimonadota bacterium]MDH5803604.1 nucleotidyltransferase family protein [Gemmatimonadota bacterium]
MNREFAVQFHSLLEQAVTDRPDALGDDPMVLADRLGVGGYMRRLIAGETDGAERKFRSLKNTIIKDGASRISEILTEGGIRHFFFKGAALVGEVYETGDRDLEDVDLHVHPDDRVSALELLTAKGCRPDPESEQAGPPELRATLSLSMPLGQSELERVWVDVHWAVEPLSHLLPRSDLELPSVVWAEVARSGGLPAPSRSHHAVLLMQHLAHHDFLHLRGVVDVALLWQDLLSDHASAAGLARQIGFEKPAVSISAWLNRILGLEGPEMWRREWRRLRVKKFSHGLSFSDLCVQRAARSEDDFQRINRDRIKTRLKLLGPGALPGLLQDVVFPPQSFIRWRWPKSSVLIPGRVLHFRQVLAKILGK